MRPNGSGAGGPILSAMPRPSTADARDLLRFLDASPSPYHAVATVAARLDAAGFERRDERDRWPAAPGPGYTIRGGSLVAWGAGSPSRLAGGFRLVGAHTDSPNLRVKPRPDTGRVGVRQVGVEVYGGALYNSWLDRDLGLSGRVALRSGSLGEPASALVRIDRPLLRIPQLAIHLDRGVNETGVKLNAQQHLVPVSGLGPATDGAFADLLANELGVAFDDVLSWDVMLHDLTPAALLGVDEELVSSARLDNLASCWAATEALVAATASAASDGPDGPGDGTRGVPVICLFDHEEIGSQSATGAAGTILPTILERVTLAAGLERDDHLAALARSWCVSADGAHATHPNYAERHEPAHHIALDGGPVLKLNANVRYATDAPGAARFKLAAERAGVPVQEFVTRTDMPCGSTIGPVTAATLGIPTVDAGIAQLSMHSARELCGAADPGRFAAVLTEVLAGA
jgi:aspartyl aminopeptidase